MYDFLRIYERQNIDHIQYEKDFFAQDKRSKYGTSEELQCLIFDIIDSKRSQKRITILDVGCDAGGLGEYFLDHADFEYHLEGFDFPGTNKVLLRRHGYSHVYEGYHVAIIPNKYDFVICNHVLEHLFPQDMDSWISALKRIGRFVIVASPFPWYTMAWNKDYLEASRKCTASMTDERLYSLVGGIHKCFVTKKIMRKHGFIYYKNKHPYMSCFFTYQQTAESNVESSVKPHVSLYGRRLYESVLELTIRNESFRYKCMRVCMDVTTRMGLRTNRLFKLK